MKGYLGRSTACTPAPEIFEGLDGPVPKQFDYRAFRIGDAQASAGAGDRRRHS